MYNKACIILFLIFTLSCTKNTKNNPQSKLYSKWIIESRMGDFSNKKRIQVLKPIQRKEMWSGIMSRALWPKPF